MLCQLSYCPSGVGSGSPRAPEGARKHWCSPPRGRVYWAFRARVEPERASTRPPEPARPRLPDRRRPATLGAKTVADRDLRATILRPCRCSPISPRARSSGWRSRCRSAPSAPTSSALGAREPVAHRGRRRRWGWPAVDGAYAVLAAAGGLGVRRWIGRSGQASHPRGGCRARRGRGVDGLVRRAALPPPGRNGGRHADSPRGGPTPCWSR